VFAREAEITKRAALATGAVKKKKTGTPGPGTGTGGRAVPQPDLDAHVAQQLLDPLSEALALC
jgi:hypothetical protein